MKTIDFETSLGVVPVTGIDFGGDRPAVLLITGAYAPKEYFETLPLLVPAFICHLPGNHSPSLAETSITGFATAFDEVSLKLQRSILALGVSTGALVAMAMATPKFIIAVEPFLSTAKLWPLLPGLQAGVGTKQHGAFLNNIFGLSSAGLVDRSYQHIVDRLTISTEIVAGDSPLFPERHIDALPSLLDEEDRAYLRSKPVITFTEAPQSGHDVPWYARRFLLERIKVRLSEIANEAAPEI